MSASESWVNRTACRVPDGSGRPAEVGSDRYVVQRIGAGAAAGFWRRPPLLAQTPRAKQPIGHQSAVAATMWTSPSAPRRN